MLDNIAVQIPLIAARLRRSQPPVMPTGQQIRAARAMLRWSAAHLARQAGVSWRTIQRAEAAEGVPRMHIDTLEKIKAAFEAAGIEFLQASQRSNGGGPGIRRR
jgi:transcriptional regulator with XRE-family HTH domain